MLRLSLILSATLHLLLLAELSSAYSPYPDHGNDIPWPSNRQWCARRPVQQCCPGRDDYCTMPILDTVCYCDIFCNRTISDCCPDFWGHCMGIDPPPGALTAPPVVDVVNNCIHMGKIHQLGDMMESNCNNCTCVSVPGIKTKKEWNWKCTQHLCVIRPEFIDYINSANKGWRAGNYSFLWGMTLEEGVTYRLGTFRPMEPVRDMTSLKVHINEILPAEFDSREEWPGLVHDVYDQGNCGSSWAFSTTSVAADRLSIHSNGYLKEMLSPQQLISCSFDSNQKGCEGGHLDRAWWYMRSKGVVSEDCYPYTSGKTNSAGQCFISSFTSTSKPRCPSTGRQSSKVYQASPPYRIARSEREIMKEIMENGPVQATLEVKEDFFMYSGGVYSYSMPADYMFPNHRKTGFHSVRILGWGTDYSLGRPVNYWLCANSWGTQWGERGLFRIVRGDNECKIESFVVGVWGKVDEQQIVRRKVGGRRGGRIFNQLRAQGDQPSKGHKRRKHKKGHKKGHKKEKENMGFFNDLKKHLKKEHKKDHSKKDHHDHKGHHKQKEHSKKEHKKDHVEKDQDVRNTQKDHVEKDQDVKNTQKDHSTKTTVRHPRVRAGDWQINHQLENGDSTNAPHLERETNEQYYQDISKMLDLQMNKERS